MATEAIRSPAPASRTYHFQNFVLDTASLTVRRGDGPPLHLRPKAFATLLYLIDHRDRVVPKRELLRAVWAVPAVTEDVLVGCIREIRLALGDAKEVIRTVPKTGYQFIGEVAEPEPPAAPLPPPKTHIRLTRWAALAILPVAAAAVWWFWPRPVREVGWWRFEEPMAGIVADSSGMHNHGKIVGTVRHSHEGPLGNALEFPGTAYILGDSPGRGFPQGRDSFAVAAWLRIPPTVVNVSGFPVLHFGTAGQEPRSNVHLLVGRSGDACLGWGFGFGLACGGKTLADDRWHHVVGTYSNSSRLLRVFADGADYARLTMAEPSALGHATPWTIAKYQTGGYSYVGWLSDIRLYNGLLNHSDIDALHRCTAPEGGLSLPGAAHGYLVPLYRATVDRLREPWRGTAGFEYSGFGKGGAEFAISDGACSLASLCGAALPADLRIRADIFLPAGTEAGPFFRARQVRPGEPIEGRGFGGFWPRMNSSGELAVYSLAHPEKAEEQALAVGTSPVPVHPDEWHTLEAEAAGTTLRVRVDGRPVSFRVRGTQTTEVPVAHLKAETGAGIGVKAPPIPTEAILVRSIEVTLPGQ